MKQKQLTAVILGAGHRSLIYGDLSLQCPDKLKIVAVADIDPDKAHAAARRYGVPEERVYGSVEALAAEGKIADIAINGTLDEVHVKTSLPLIALGYDILLEKPFATSREELWTLYCAAKKHNSRVFICHVLRYSAFYRAICLALNEGKIGKIVSINMAEDISRHHMVVSYVRGQWNNETLSAPLLLAKSCHDIDLMMWLMGKDRPVNVYSVGSDFAFQLGMAPEGAGTRCLLDCPIEKECPYSAAKQYLGKDFSHSYYVFQKDGMSDEARYEALKCDSPYGRCVWHCDHKGVDHQSVTVSFASGAVGMFTLTGGAPRDERRIHIVGTEGSITGIFEENAFVLRRFDAKNGYTEEVIRCDVPAATLHGGGDRALVLDFCSYICSGERSISCSELGDSLAGHLTVYAAEESRKSGKVVPIEL